MKTITSMGRWLALAAVLAAVVYGFSFVNAFRSGPGAAQQADTPTVQPTSPAISPDPTEQPPAPKAQETPTATPAVPAWASFSYDSSKGGLRPAGGNPPPPPPSPVRYTVGYPAGWTAATTSDTASEFGQVQFRPPQGKSVIDVSAVLLRPGGFTLDDLVTNDRTFLDSPVQEPITVPAGSGIRLSGTMNNSNQAEDAGKPWQVVYVKQGSVVYRMFLLQAPGEDLGELFARLIETMKPAAG